MQEVEWLKQEILRDYPRLSEQSSFSFACHPGISCFNDCCGDVNIFLTPYDVLRLKTNLGISSSSFLSKYAVKRLDADFTYPVVLLNMSQDEQKRCPLLGQHGCQVYQDRPWACRMYPLGMASAKVGDSLNEPFFFLLEDGGCKGLAQQKLQTVSQWLQDQGIEEYDRMGQLFKELTLHEFFQEGGRLTPAKAEMFCLACYDLDRFRDFVFRSTFLEKFEVDDGLCKRIQEDDLELLKFGHAWLRLALFGERTLEIKRTLLQANRRKLETEVALG